MDRLTKEQRHKNMVAVKNKGTQPELLLAKAMWHSGLRYRKNDKSVFGHPDFVHKGKKIAVFVDGDMWHGRDWETQKMNFKSHQDFWLPKIERNMQRDVEVNNYLQGQGWCVLRFWESEIENNIKECLIKIKKVYSNNGI